MPNLLRLHGYRFYFYSHEPNEPPHIHIDKDDKTAKIWLADLSVAKSIGFRQHELRRVIGMVADNRDDFLAGWYDYFGT
ncbi:MAG: DUF4160 domain-containing protein [Pseudomonadota bacterium]